MSFAKEPVANHKSHKGRHKRHQVFIRRQHYMRVTSEGIHQADQLPRHMVTRHVSPSVSAPAVSFPFNRVCFPAMKMNSVSEITGNASLMLFFVTDTGSALTAPVIRVTPTVFFVAKTTRSVTVQPSSVSRKPCFSRETRCSVTKTLASGVEF